MFRLTCKSSTEDSDSWKMVKEVYPLSRKKDEKNLKISLWQKQKLNKTLGVESDPKS